MLRFYHFVKLAATLSLHPTKKNRRQDCPDEERKQRHCTIKTTSTTLFTMRRFRLGNSDAGVVIN